MENQEKSDRLPDGKLSLIDILIVLLKYWKLIVVLISAAFIFIVLGYFFFTSYQYNRQQRNAVLEFEPEVIMAVSLVPAVDFFIPNSQYGFYFRRPDVIAAALEKSNIISSSEKMADWVLPVSGEIKSAEKIYSSRNERLYMKEHDGTGVIEFVYRGTDSAAGILFLNNLFIMGNEALQEYINFQGKAYIDVFETAVEKLGASAYEKLLIEKSWNSYLLAQEIFSGTVSASTMLIKPYVINSESSASDKTLADYKKAYKSKAVLFMLAAFLLTIFLVFLINEITSIKNNTETMEKIRGAVKRPEKDHL
jgi:hypothetical protein